MLDVRLPYPYHIWTLLSRRNPGLPSHPAANAWICVTVRPSCAGPAYAGAAVRSNVVGPPSCCTTPAPGQVCHHTATSLPRVPATNCSCAGLPRQVPRPGRGADRGHRARPCCCRGLLRPGGRLRHPAAVPCPRPSCAALLLPPSALHCHPPPLFTQVAAYLNGPGNKLEATAFFELVTAFAGSLEKAHDDNAVADAKVVEGEGEGGALQTRNRGCLLTCVRMQGPIRAAGIADS